MRKVFAAAALCAVAIVAVAAASGAAAKGPQKINGKLNVSATPTNEATPPSTKVKTTKVTVTGTLKSQPSCLAHRKIGFTYVTPSGSYALSETAVTSSKGSFTATLPAPTGIIKTGSAVTVSASTKRVSRRDKKSGEKVICLDASGITDFTDLT